MLVINLLMSQLAGQALRGLDSLLGVKGKLVNINGKTP